MGGDRGGDESVAECELSVAAVQLDAAAEPVSEAVAQERQVLRVGGRGQG